MTRRIPWIAAAIIIVAAIGAWTVFGGAPAAPAPEGEWHKVNPGQAYGFPTHSPLSGITAIHFMKHGSWYDNTDNLANIAQNNDNRIGSITSSGSTIATFPFDTTFDIAVDVQGHNDNMGQITKNYLTVELAFYLDTGYFMPNENSLDINEHVFGSSADTINVNAIWDNNGHGYTLSADDNMYLENVSLYLRG